MSTATSNLVREAFQPKFRRVDTDDDGHIYLYGEREVPGLTHVLQEMGFSDFGAAPMDVVARKARLGKAVHRATEMIEQKMEMQPLHPVIQPYVDAYCEFMAKVDVRTRFNEKGWDCLEEPCHVVYGVMGGGCQLPFEFACTCDRKGILQGDDHLGVLEIKCTAKAERAHELQTAGQADTIEAYKEHPRYCLYLKPDGKYKLIRHKNYSQDSLAWRQILAAYTWRGEYA